MTETGPPSPKVVNGTIRCRLLVNVLVDPDEAAARLPHGVRAHETEHGTVVGCCLLDIGQVRPRGVPAPFGRTVRAVAHRISAEWTDSTGSTVTGVYVPVRHTDSRLAAVLGGRWFPGVHRRAHVEVADVDGTIRWTSDPIDGPDLRIGLVASPTEDASGVCDVVGTTCVGASVGVSPGHRGALEAVHMRTDHHRATEVVVEELDSPFLAGFSTARPARSYLMTDVDVTWTPAVAPALIGAPISGRTGART